MSNTNQTYTDPIADEEKFVSAFICALIFGISIVHRFTDSSALGMSAVIHRVDIGEKLVS
mgnify:CR=1 FL=1